MKLSRLFSIFSSKKNVYEITPDQSNTDSKSLFDALCRELRELHFRMLPNGQKIDGYCMQDLYIHIARNGHDLEAMIDEEEIIVIVDEETEYPIERVLQMADFSCTTEVYDALCALAIELCEKDIHSAE